MIKKLIAERMQGEADHKNIKNVMTLKITF